MSNDASLLPPPEHIIKEQINMGTKGHKQKEQSK